MDISQRKLIKYNHNGDYIDNMSVPFDCKGFVLLDNNKMLFKLDTSKDLNYQLCVTDSMLKPLSYMLRYPNGYVGGWVTDAVFQKNEKGKFTHGMHLLNNPVGLSNGLYFMEVTDYTNEGTYSITYNSVNGMHKAVKFAENMSIYDVIIPCTSNKNNQVISYLDRIIAGKCYNFDIMPDSLVKALEDGNRLLVIHKTN